MPGAPTYFGTALLMSSSSSSRPFYLSFNNHDTRSVKYFHLPITNLTIYQEGAYYTGTKIFNHLPTRIKNVASEIQVFKKTLKSFLLDNSFYSIDEHFNANK
jgi:hypothetical protein